MSPDQLLGYLSRLLNRPVSASESVSLSSAQRARFRAWLENYGVASDLIPNSAAFDVGQLAGRLGAAAPASASAYTPRPVSPPSVGPAGLAAPMYGIGIDIQSVSELINPESLSDPKADAELCGIFSLRELSYAQTKDDVGQTLAGLFAAKEAIRKADPGCLRQRLPDLEILPDEHGAPQFPGFAISISHSGGVAVAIAMRSMAPTGFSPVTAAAPSPMAEPSLAPVTATAKGADAQRSRRVGGLEIALMLVLIGTGAGILWLHGFAR